MEVENRRVTVLRDFPEIFAPVTKGFSANEIKKRRFKVIRDFQKLSDIYAFNI